FHPLDTHTHNDRSGNRAGNVRANGSGYRQRPCRFDSRTVWRALDGPRDAGAADRQRGVTVSEFVGIAAATELLGVPRFVSVPFAAAAVWWLVVKGSYK